MSVKCKMLIKMAFVLYLLDFIQTAEVQLITDRLCSVEKTDRVFRCKKINGLPIPRSNVRVTLNTRSRTLYIKSASMDDIRADYIDKGALSILFEDKPVDRIKFSRITFNKLRKSDFNGVKLIVELSINNPYEVMDPDTLVGIMPKSKPFQLNIACLSGNQQVSFRFLILKSKGWKIKTTNCMKQLRCVTCINRTPLDYKQVFQTDTQSITSTSVLASYNCQEKSECSKLFPSNTSPTVFNNKTKTSSSSSKKAVPITTATSTKISDKSPHQRIDTNKNRYYNKSKDDDNNNTNFVWIVMMLCVINSIAILIILIFLICWWYRMKISNTSSKHTIILEDGEDKTKYMKLDTH